MEGTVIRINKSVKISKNKALHEGQKTKTTNIWGEWVEWI